MTSRPLPQCVLCKHWLSPLDTPDPNGPQTCTAFPAEIPHAIWWNEADHRKPFTGDKGIHWESNGEPFPEWVLE